MPAILCLLLLFAGEPESGAPVKVATWNLENFYDLYDDPYRRDEITRPQYVSEKRKGRLAEVIKRLDADVLLLQEIENRFILQEFVENYLPGSNYRIVLHEGNDSRGIDVALLTRLPIESVTTYRHLEFQDADGKRQWFRRDLLRVRIGGELRADVFVVHLKSQAGGEASDRVRLAEARAVAAILRAEMEADPDYRALLGGDFNDLHDSPTLEALFETGLVDACQGSEHKSYNQDPYRSRIDFLLMTPALAKDLAGPGAILEDELILATSDHNPVTLTLK